MPIILLRIDLRLELLRTDSLGAKSIGQSCIFEWNETTTTAYEFGGVADYDSSTFGSWEYNTGAYLILYPDITDHIRPTSGLIAYDSNIENGIEGLELKEQGDNTSNVLLCSRIQAMEH